MMSKVRFSNNAESGETQTEARAEASAWPTESMT